MQNREKEDGYKGLLVTNAFLRTGKFVEHYEWLREAALQRGMTLDIIENAERLLMIEEEPAWLSEYDFVIYWDKDISYGKSLSMFADRYQIPIMNSVESVGICDDKCETYLRLAAWNAAHPKEKIRLLPTIPAPMTYANIGYTKTDFLDKVEERLGYPMIVKECFGSFGMQVYMAQDRKMLEQLTGKLGGKPFLYQKYHQYSSGRDVRLQVVGCEVVAAMERYSENGDFRANITNGGSMKPYIPSKEECSLAVLTAQVLGLDFCGVDLLFDEESGRADIVCEVNSNAHFKNIHTCTGVNVAEKIMEHILKLLEDRKQAPAGTVFP